MGVTTAQEFDDLMERVVASAPRLREAGISRLTIEGIAVVELAATPPGKPLTNAEQDALEARLHKLEQERAGREAEEARRVQTAAAGGFRRRA